MASGDLNKTYEMVWQRETEKKCVNDETTEDNRQTI